MPGGHCRAVQSYNYYYYLYKLLLLFMHAIPCGHWNAAHREGQMYLTPRINAKRPFLFFPFLFFFYPFFSVCIFPLLSFAFLSLLFFFLCSSICFAPAERLRVCCKKEGKKQNMAFGALMRKSPGWEIFGCPVGWCLTRDKTTILILGLASFATWRSSLSHRDFVQLLSIGQKTHCQDIWFAICMLLSLSM